MVLYHAYELWVILNPNSRILFRIALRDLQRPVRATVINYDILPIRVRLVRHALDALRQIFLAVVDRRNQGNQWLR